MFQRLARAINEQDIREIEHSLEITIPVEVREHYVEQNGGVPEPNCWYPEDDEPLCIARFLPMKYPGKADDLTVESVYRKGISKDYLIKNLVPFAVDWGTNFFCFNERGDVYFYAMDAWSGKLSTEENKRKAAKFLVGSFREFIAGLKPEETYENGSDENEE